VILPGGHFDAYIKGFDSASVPARDWFAQHLAPWRRLPCPDRPRSVTT